MSESVNHTECEHKCDHSKFTGPITIEATKQNNKGNTAIKLPLIVETETENEDGTTTILKASSMLFEGNTDFFRIRFQSDTDTESYAELATSDNGNEPIYVRQYSYQPIQTTGFGSIIRTLTLLDSKGNTTIPGNLYLEKDLYFTGNVYKYNPSDNTRQLVNFTLGEKEEMP